MEIRPYEAGPGAAQLRVSLELGALIANDRLVLRPVELERFAGVEITVLIELVESIERLEKLIAAFKKAAFGRKSVKSDPDQFNLAPEDLETAMSAIHADAAGGQKVARPRAINRGSLPTHLPLVEELIEPESPTCACGHCLHCIGEDVFVQLDVLPAQFRVIVTRRPKYAGRACTESSSTTRRKRPSCNSPARTGTIQPIASLSCGTRYV